jgi:hypothetical protein
MALNVVMKGALLYGGTMALVGLATGQGLNLAGNAIDGAIMGGAILADDLTHATLMMDPSVASSAVVTGGWFAAMQSLLRGDSRLVRNVAAGGVTSVVLDTYY